LKEIEETTKSANNQWQNDNFAAGEIQSNPYIQLPELLIAN
jgi:hypothetical protein